MPVFPSLARERKNRAAVQPLLGQEGVYIFKASCQTLHIDKLRQHNGPGLCLAVEEVLQRALQAARPAPIRPLDFLAAGGNQRVRFLQVHEAPADDLRLADELLVLVHRDQRHDEAVLRQALPVADDHLADLADQAAIDEHVIHLKRLFRPRTLAIRYPDCAVLQDEHVLVLHPGFPRKLRVQVQMACLPVHGDHELRADRLDHRA